MTKDPYWISCTTAESSFTGLGFRAWGERAGELIEPLLAELQKLPVGRPPEISRSIFVRGEVRTSASAFTAGIPNVSRSEHIPLEQLEIPVRPELPVKNPPEVFVSYAWRNSFSVNLVEKFCLSLQSAPSRILSNFATYDCIWKILSTLLMTPLPCAS